MIRKILAHGHPILKQEGEWVEEDYPNLPELISDMFETMSGAHGIGLAAQQIGLPIKLFVLDLTFYSEKDESLKDFKKTFLNSEILEESQEMTDYEEGCLSFPGIHFNVSRPSRIKVLYQDENFVEHQEWLEGIAAIAFQHEHDHTEGIVFTERVGPLKRKLLQKKLSQISRAEFGLRYPMQFK